MMLPQDPRVKLPPKVFLNAMAPFPRSCWVNPIVPFDNFDCVCKIIWLRAKEAELGRLSPEKQQSKAKHSRASERVQEQQKKMDDFGLWTQYEEDKKQRSTDFTLPCPYLSGHRHVAKPALMRGPVMEREMIRYEEKAKGQRNVEETAGKEGFQTPSKKVWVPQSTGRRARQTPTPRLQPLLRNPASLQNNQYQHEKDYHLRPSELPRNTCESEDDLDVKCSSESNSSDDDDTVTLPGARTCASDSSDGDDSARNNKGEQSNDELSSDREQCYPSLNTEQDFPRLSTIKAGIQPCPTKPLASGKKHSQWEIPLSFQQHDIPTATLACGLTTLAQAGVQDKVEAAPPCLKTNAPLSAPVHQAAYDLLADFPALQPPTRPFRKGEVQDGIPKAKGKRGPTHLLNHRQENTAFHQGKVEIGPLKVSSICAGDQKSVLDFQTFGSPIECSAPTISCEEIKANNESSPGVAGTDGVGGNARSWANAAKAGMKRAAAPQVKARPCTFQQIVTIDRAKGRFHAPQNFTMTAVKNGPRPRHPNQIVRPGFLHPHQHSGAQVQRASRPPGIRWPRVPFQQVRGHLHKQV